MQHNARNDIVGKVLSVEKSQGLMGMIKVKIEGEFILSSVMTNESIDAFDVKEGDDVRALVKGIHVLLVK